MDNDFTIHLGGDGRIKVDTLTHLLEYYNSLFYQLNRELGFSDDDLIIEVSPPENGSFKIKVTPKFKDNFVKLTHNPTFAASFAVLLTFFVIEKSKPSTSDIITELSEKGMFDKTVVHNTYNIYQKREIKNTISQSFQVISKDDNVESLKVIDESLEQEIIDVSRNQFEEFGVIENESIEEEVKEKTETIEAVIVVKTICFEGTSKWEFIWNNNPIKATIKDENFYKKFDDEPFYRGDRLIVLMEVRKIFDNDLNVYVEDKKGYKVMEVLDHKRKSESQNLALDF